MILEFKNIAGTYKPRISGMKVIHYADEKIDEHKHDFYELVIVQIGDGIHVIDGKNIQLSAGQIFVIRPGQRHYYTGFSHLTLLTFMFDVDILDFFTAEFMDIDGFRNVFGEKSADRQTDHLHYIDDITISQLNILLEQIVDEQINRQPGFRYALIALLLEVILFISRNCRNGDAGKISASGRIAMVISHIEKNFNRELNLKILAGIAGMSITNFRRYFKRKIGESPIKYLLKLRVQKAADLLMCSSLSISDIAHKTGFSDSNYFCRQFSYIAGVSPRKYRESDHGVVYVPLLDQTEGVSKSQLRTFK